MRDPLERTAEAHRTFTSDMFHHPEPKPENARTRALRTAEELVNGDRNNQYGDPIEDFRRTAQLWNAYLGLEKEDTLLPHDVAALMSLLKLSRIRWSPEKEDSWIDLAGYAACGLDCVERQ